MIKRKFSLLTCFIFLSLCLACLTACSDLRQIEVNGIKYEKTTFHFVSNQTVEEGYNVVGCADDIEILDIPSTVNGLPVLGLGREAFSSNTTIREVIIPDSMSKSSLGGCPFLNCINIEKITAPSTKIMSLFTEYGSSDMNKEHTIPESVHYIYLSNACTEINIHDFYYCTNIREIHIPKSVTKIDDGTSYTSIGVNGNKPAGKFGNLPFIGCEKLTIYCEAESKPSGWGEYWNYIDSENQAPVHWNAY